MSSIVRNSDDDPLVIAIQQPRIAIESVSPVVEEGAYPAKTESDRDLRLAARIFADGHEVLGAEVVWRRVGETAERRLPLLPEGNDFWSAQLRTPPCGRLYFRIETWIDRFAGYRRELRAKHGARLPLDLELREGDELLQRCAERGGPEIAAACAPLAERLQACQSVEERVALWLAAQTGELLRLVGPREHLVRSREYPVEVERPLARFASWYELFPRSESGDPARHGTFDDVIRRLPQIAAMGFDVLYFPPIHPIGRTHRKGRNNSLRAEAGDPGSPYAIGSEEGGHEAIHPELGDREDFRRLLVAVREHGMELALDFAIQCSPDHPWLREHPGWFAWRPDGSLRYAENPPKKYEDIVNVDFYAEQALPSLWEALRDVVLGWVEQGVTLFRVDNPHTKPLPFWEWLIAEVRGRHPQVIFLSEAFTRPAMMARLGKVGFSQSYTYFTWRNDKQELAEYFAELNQPPWRDCYRPNFFVNTPGHQSLVPATLRPPRLPHPCRPGDHGVGAVGHVLRLRAVRGGGLAGQGGVPRLGEIPVASARLPGAGQHRRRDRPAQPHPPGKPGIADAPRVPGLQRLERPHPVFRQAHRGPRQLRPGGGLPGPARSPGGAFRTAAVGVRPARRRQPPGRGPDERASLGLARQGPVDAHRTLAPAVRHLARAARRRIRRNPWPDARNRSFSTTRNGTRTR
ncbi:putative alpha-amylase family protein [Pseudomonas aeruginosa]|nr:putative alpha-amylase family protein [Pseudomonas aeruginosa]